MDFPSKKGNEMVVPNEDGSYTILINAGLNYESQLKAYEHAMSHITNDDFSKGNVQEIEYYAHHLHKDPEPVQDPCVDDEHNIQFLVHYLLKSHHLLYGSWHAHMP